MRDNTTPRKFKIIWLASVGGALEFFDFTIYALFATYISHAFFPSHDKIISLIITFSVFALGYLARPLGGVFFGHIGDKKGCRFAFTTAVLIMATSTLLMGCLPSYYSWGISAPLLLIVLRLFQGFSVGGEIPGAVVFTLEHVPEGQRGVSIAIIFSFITLGNALASLIGFILTKLLDHKSMLAWGWRIPFFIGFLLGIVSYLLRKKSFETPIFQRLASEKLVLQQPLLTLLKTAKRLALVGFGLTGISAATIATAIAEQFPPSIIHSGMGISFNLGLALFGGLAPLISTLFIKFSSSNIAPYYYLLLCGLLTIISSICFITKKPASSH